MTPSACLKSILSDIYERTRVWLDSSDDCRIVRASLLTGLDASVYENLTPNQTVSTTARVREQSESFPTSHDFGMVTVTPTPMTSPYISDRFTADGRKKQRRRDRFRFVFDPPAQSARESLDLRMTKFANPSARQAILHYAIDNPCVHRVPRCERT